MMAKRALLAVAEDRDRIEDEQKDEHHKEELERRGEEHLAVRAPGSWRKANNLKCRTVSKNTHRDWLHLRTRLELQMARSNRVRNQFIARIGNLGAPAWLCWDFR